MRLARERTPLSKVSCRSVSHNQFNGTVPASLGNLKLLQYMCVDRLAEADRWWPGALVCSLTLAFRTSHRCRDFSYNALGGSIPAEIGALPNLYSL